MRLHHASVDLSSLNTRTSVPTTTTLTVVPRKSFNQYAIVASLGRGQYGTVYKAFDRDRNNVVVAVKACRRVNPQEARLQLLRQNNPNNHHPPDAGRQMKIQREIAILKMCNHAQIVRLIEVIDDPNHHLILMVMEYMAAGTLSFADSNSKPVLSTPQIRRILRDVTVGLEYLHHINIIHRDIKPANLLYTQDRRTVKIADFGVSHHLSDESALRKMVGTPAFLAPEVVWGFNDDAGYSEDGVKEEPPPITPAVDIWALGITLYCMMFGHPPWTTSIAQAHANSPEPPEDLNLNVNYIATEYALYTRIKNDPYELASTIGYDALPVPNDYSHIPRRDVEGEWQKVDPASSASEEGEDEARAMLDLLSHLLEKKWEQRWSASETKRSPWVLKDVTNTKRWLRDTTPNVNTPLSPSPPSPSSPTETSFASRDAGSKGGAGLMRLPSLTLGMMGLRGRTEDSDRVQRGSQKTADNEKGADMSSPNNWRAAMKREKEKMMAAKKEGISASTSARDVGSGMGTSSGAGNSTLGEHKRGYSTPILTMPISSSSKQRANTTNVTKPLPSPPEDGHLATASRPRSGSVPGLRLSGLDGVGDDINFDPYLSYYNSGSPLARSPQEEQFVQRNRSSTTTTNSAASTTTYGSDLSPMMPAFNDSQGGYFAGIGASPGSSPHSTPAGVSPEIDQFIPVDPFGAGQDLRPLRPNTEASGPTLGPSLSPSLGTVPANPQGLSAGALLARKMFGAPASQASTISVATVSTVASGVSGVSAAASGTSEAGAGGVSGGSTSIEEVTFELLPGPLPLPKGAKSKSKVQVKEPELPQTSSSTSTLKAKLGRLKSRSSRTKPASSSMNPNSSQVNLNESDTEGQDTDPRSGKQTQKKANLSSSVSREGRLDDGSPGAGRGTGQGFGWRDRVIRVIPGLGASS